MMLSEKRLLAVPSVLVVDDDRDNLHLIKCILEALNLKCYGVSDSRKVLDLAVDQTPNLILLDIVMPNVSGFEIIKQLKSNLYTRNIPTIAITGLTSLCHQAQIKSAGFEDYISKPFAIEELEAKLNQYLNLDLCLQGVAA